MNQVTALKKDTIWRHKRKGTYYTIDKLTNQHSTEPEKFPLTVVYVDTDAREWSRPVADFLVSFEPV